MEILSLIIAIIALTFALPLKKQVATLKEEVKSIQIAKREKPAEQMREKETLVAKEELPQELLSYVREQTNAGVSESDILNNLLQNGWEKSDLTKAIAYMRGDGAHEEKIAPAEIMPTVDARGRAFVEWIKEDWLMKLGALLFIIGIGWFVTFAFMNNWIGEMGRITLGLITGAAVLALGSWRMRNFKNQGAVLVALGAAVITITAIAARELYGFFTPVSELGIIFLTSAFAAFASVKYRSQSLAALSIVLGHIAPVFVGGIPDTLLAFVYLFVVAVSTLWVAAFTGWRFLAATSLAFFAWYSFTGGIPDNIIILFIFAAMYFAANVAAIIKSEKPTRTDVSTAAGLAILLVVWVLQIVPDVWQSMAIAGWVVLFTIAAFAAFKMSGSKEPLLIYSAIAVGLLGAATAMELSGPALTLAYTFEITALAFATAFVTGSIKYAQQMSLLFLVPIVLSFESINSFASRSSILHDDFFVLFSLSAVLLGLGAFFLTRGGDSQDELSNNGTITSLVFGTLYALALVWLSLHAVYEREIATTVALVFYTILGMTAYISGKMRGIHGLFVAGGVLLGAVVLRLIFIEAWRLDMAGKIVVFLLIGALLVTTAFIGRSRGSNQK